MTPGALEPLPRDGGSNLVKIGPAVLDTNCLSRQYLLMLRWPLRPMGLLSSSLCLGANGVVVFAVSYDIQKLCGIKIQLSIDSENRVVGEENRKVTKSFMDKYKASWEVDVKKRACHLLRERKLNAMTELPDPADIAKLAQRMQERMQMMHV